jgi:hypothetical protein
MMLARQPPTELAIRSPRSLHREEQVKRQNRSKDRNDQEKVVLGILPLRFAVGVLPCSSAVAP